MNRTLKTRIIVLAVLVAGVALISRAVWMTHTAFQPVDYAHPGGVIFVIFYIPPVGAVGGLLIGGVLSRTVFSDMNSVGTALIYPLAGAAGVVPSVYYMMAFADRRHTNELAQLTDWLLVGAILGFIPALYVGYRRLRRDS